MGRTTKTRLAALATLTMGALLAGCGAEDVRGGYAQEPIQFGIWQPDADGAMRFTATPDVPNEEDQTYGWRVRVAESEEAVKWVETLTLPEAPVSWEGVEDDPNVMISDDGRTVTTVGADIPDGGYLENSWFVAFDDPPGEYVMSVELSDGRRATFTFRLGEATADGDVSLLKLAWQATSGARQASSVWTPQARSVAGLHDDGASRCSFNAWCRARFRVR